jgi:nondiscriminating glutamyl-tRNA synthetase
MIRVRFAPSPTGFLHIGGARTALFNWLYAKAKQGAFVLRIEDTDAKRSQKEYLDEILYSLDWLGLHWDEIYYQSQRFEIYTQYAKKLLDEGKAYRALKVEEGQPAGTKEAIIYKVAPRTIKINDLIRGEIEFDSSVIKDQVLIKSDGTPTYNFACVVDDALMQISHVIRGDDHISNTPKQIILYEALGFTPPKFAHLPLILSKGGGRLSKRKGATAISDYHTMGYLPGALVNYLLLLGWSPGGNQELIPIEEAIRLFDITHINKTAAVLDLDKLDWMNSQYLKNEAPGRLAEEVIPLLLEKKLIKKEQYDKDYIVSLVQLFQGRLTTMHDFVTRADCFLLEDIVMDPQAEQKHLAGDFSKEFKLFIERLEALEKFDIITIEGAFRKMVEELHIEAKSLIHPIRVALTGKTVGPGLFEVIYYLGKERVRKRLQKWVKKEVS